MSITQFLSNLRVERLSWCVIVWALWVTVVLAACVVTIGDNAHTHVNMEGHVDEIEETTKVEEDKR